MSITSFGVLKPTGGKSGVCEPSNLERMGSESSSGCGVPQGVLGCDLGLGEGGSQVGSTPESQQIWGIRGGHQR